MRAFYDRSMPLSFHEAMARWTENIDVFATLATTNIRCHSSHDLLHVDHVPTAASNYAFLTIAKSTCARTHKKKTNSDAPKLKK